jgi:hypothetical protein
MFFRTILLTMIAITVFCFEQVLGLPLLFFAIVLWFSHGLNPLGRQVLLAVGGLMIGLVYHLPLAGTWLLMVALALGWNATQGVIKSDSARLILLSLGGTGVIAVVSRFEWTAVSLVAVAISLAATVIFAHSTFFITNSAGRLRLAPSLRVVRSEKI